MNFKFQINIKKTNSRKIKSKPQSINKLKQSLVLAHQMLNYIETNNLSFHAAAELTNTSAARISQLMNLLSLAPAIQEQIILANNSKLKLRSERKLREITKKLLWQEQKNIFYS